MVGTWQPYFNLAKSVFFTFEGIWDGLRMQCCPKNCLKSCVTHLWEQLNLKTITYPLKIDIHFCSQKLNAASVPLGQEGINKLGISFHVFAGIIPSHEEIRRSKILPLDLANLE